MTPPPLELHVKEDLSYVSNEEFPKYFVTEYSLGKDRVFKALEDAKIPFTFSIRI